MKYLFFDIECADGGKATICSFGYVISDLNFNILEQRDILINPEAEFCLEGRKGRPDVKLAYPKEDFLNAPTFDKLYDEIKAILESKEYYVIGHSVENDIKYLNMACKRYGMPPLEFEYFDTQRTYKDIQGQKQSISLQNALIALGLEKEIIYHRSDEDARATMLLLKALLHNASKDFVDYAESSYDCTGRTFDFYWGWNGQSMDRYNDVYCVRYTKDFIREILPGEENSILRSNENFVNFQRYIDKGKPIGDESTIFKNIKICLSLNYESRHYKEMLYIVGLIKAAGGTYTRKPTEANAFVTYFYDSNGLPTDKCTRLKEIKSSEDQNEVEIIDFKSFLSLLNVTENDLSSVQEIREDYFLSVREI
jgi:DNA polymerase III epsilon subunit-like protein